MGQAQLVNCDQGTESRTTSQAAQKRSATGRRVPSGFRPLARPSRRCGAHPQPLARPRFGAATEKAEIGTQERRIRESLEELFLKFPRGPPPATPNSAPRLGSSHDNPPLTYTLKMSSRGKAKRPTQHTNPKASAGTGDDVLRAQARLQKAVEAVRAAEKGRRDAIRKAKASGMSAVELAELLSISRQQVYAIAGDAKIREF